MKSKDGELIVGKEEVIARWVEHFEELLNREEPDNPITEAEGEGERSPDAEEEVEAPTVEEILRAIKKLPNNKAAGIDGIPGELFKFGGEAVQRQLARLIQEVWNRETIPGEWEEGILISIHKKEDRNVCANYRGICLLPVAYKVLAKIIYARLKLYTRQIVGEYQAGFESAKSTTDHIFTLRQALEKYHEYGKDSYHMFVDFQQAYDSIHRPSLWHILSALNIPRKLIGLVQMCYSNTRYRVRVGGELSAPFDIRGGLKQGCALSTLLFNLALEWIMRHTPLTQAPMRIGEATFDRLAFADDVDLCGEKMEAVAATYQQFKTAARRPGLEINLSKTKVMQQSRTPDMEGVQDIGGDAIEAVRSFKYLGSTVTSLDSIEEEVSLRIAAGSRCAWGLKKLLKSHMLSYKTKLQIYVVIIRPIVLYECETWRLTKELERQLDVFERSI